MRPSVPAAMLGLATVLGMWSVGFARGSDITIFLNQATASGVRVLGAGFEQATGHKVNVSVQAGRALREKIDSGAPGDLVSMLVDEFDDGLKSGKVLAGSVIEYGRVFNGVAVKAGAARPDISTPDAFRQAMLGATSIGHTMIGTGPFNTRLFQKLGIYDQIRDKIRIVPPGTLVAAAVARGDVDIGIQQANVIQPFPGTDYLGPLPPVLREYGHACVGLLAVSQQRETANAFIQFMTDPKNAALLRQASMEPPAR